MSLSVTVNHPIVDKALVCYHRYVNKEINFEELQKQMSYQDGDALSRSPYVRFKITLFASGRYRIRPLGGDTVTEAGQARLQQLLK